MQKPYNEPGAYIEWGVMTVTATGSSVEPMWGEMAASSRVRCVNGLLPGTAKVVYREVVVGEWSQGTAGNDYGTYTVWPDGTTEYRGESSRYMAEVEARRRDREGPQTSVVASRQVTYGEWWLATQPDHAGL